MSSSSSKWCDPPSDILSMIADHLDRKFGILLLRSICKSWRSSLSSSSSSSSSSTSIITFPLNLPSPISTSLSPSSATHLSLHQQTTFLLSPLSTTTTTFIIKVEESANSRNTFSLFNPLFSGVKLPPPNSPINLLDYRVTRVCDSYVVSSHQTDNNNNNNLIKKVVVARGFFVKGDFVVLGLKFNGGLLYWRFGDENWTRIVSDGRCFDDIVCYNGKFYATANGVGRLVVIDSRMKPIDLVAKLMYGNGGCTYLVECNGGLYLVDRETGFEGVKFGVFKLDDKHRFWDYEPNLDDCVFFLGDDANFSLSRKVYVGCIGDVIYFKDVFHGVNNGNGGFSQVFDVKTGTSTIVIDNEGVCKFLWPPSSWFVGVDTDGFR